MPKKIPHTLIILTVILIVFTGLTWIVPAGEFERVSSNGRDIVVPGSYKVLKQSPQDFFDFFTSPIKGFVSAGQIIAFVLIVGGAFSVINRSDAINAALQSLVRLCKKKPAFKKVIIPALIILFSLAGATFGMSEEVIVFVLITIPLALALGYDSLVGIAIPFVGAGAGFAGAFSNPFTVGIAQGIAELPPFSGS
ncbi:MAG: YfcC family protein, partial [Bacteroidota bacterium]